MFLRLIFTVVIIRNDDTDNSRKVGILGYLGTLMHLVHKSRSLLDTAWGTLFLYAFKQSGHVIDSDSE